MGKDQKTNLCCAGPPEDIILMLSPFIQNAMVLNTTLGGKAYNEPELFEWLFEQKKRK